MTGINVLTVSQLNCYVKAMFDSDKNIGNFFLRGEISNLKNHFSSGHIYFSVKDEESLVKCVMFSRAASLLKFEPKDGMKILLRGKASVYEATGQYQIYVQDMQPEGIGELYFAFEELKKKLYDEGLFDASLKKSLPRFPKKIGVITSKSGSVIKDIINVVSRRYPLCDILLKPVSVQGEDAVTQIVDALAYFNENHCVDVLILCRGGGSLEDLNAFNDETLARSVFNSKIPVISAVGHETDFTICDFVADVRAPTPSAAAEIAVPDTVDVTRYIKSLSCSLKENFRKELSFYNRTVDNLKLKLKSCSPELKLKNQQTKLETLKSQLKILMSCEIHDKINEFTSLVSKLNALNPMSVLERGYSIAYKDKRILNKVDDVDVGDVLNIRLSDGIISCTTDSVKKIKEDLGNV